MKSNLRSLLIFLSFLLLVGCAPIPRHIDSFEVTGTIYDGEEGFPLQEADIFLRAKGQPGAKKIKTAADGSFLAFWDSHWKLYRSLFADDPKEDSRELLITMEKNGYEKQEIVDSFREQHSKDGSKSDSSVDLGALYLERKR